MGPNKGIARDASFGHLADFSTDTRDHRGGPCGSLTVAVVGGAAGWAGGHPRGHGHVRRLGQRPRSIRRAVHDHHGARLDQCECADS